MARTTVAERLDADAPVLGARTTTMAPAMVEVYGRLGFDFVWLDFEHTGGSPYDSDLLDRFTRAADLADVDLLVRLPNGDPSLVRKVLDTGVRTLLVPHVDGPEDVRPAIEAARYDYDGDPGTRGSGLGRANAWGDAAVDTEAADASVAVGCMIETRAAVENVEDILAVPELGFVVVGPSDLSISHGYPFERDHPEVQAAVSSVLAAGQAAGVPVGGVTDDTGDAREKLDAGYRLLRVGDEVSAARTVLGDRLSALRE